MPLNELFKFEARRLDNELLSRKDTKIKKCLTRLTWKMLLERVWRKLAVELCDCDDAPVGVFMLRRCSADSLHRIRRCGGDCRHGCGRNNCFWSGCRHRHGRRRGRSYNWNVGCVVRGGCDIFGACCRIHVNRFNVRGARVLSSNTKARAGGSQTDQEKTEEPFLEKEIPANSSQPNSMRNNALINEKTIAKFTYWTLAGHVEY